MGCKIGMRRMLATLRARSGTTPRADGARRARAEDPGRRVDSVGARPVASAASIPQGFAVIAVSAPGSSGLRKPSI
jgi:hypothetical protein